MRQFLYRFTLIAHSYKLKGYLRLGSPKIDPEMRNCVKVTYQENIHRKNQ